MRVFYADMLPHQLIGSEICSQGRAMLLARELAESLRAFIQVPAFCGARVQNLSLNIRRTVEKTCPEMSAYSGWFRGCN